MVRSRLAAVVAAGTLALGGGMALAETDPDDPALQPVETEESDELEESEELEDAEGDEGDEGSVETGSVTEESDLEILEDHSHGALVSAAAQDHSHDEACGNHGQWVSHWARHGEAPECALATGTTDAADEVGVEGDDDSDAPGKGNGKGHGKRP